jgi:hypothetical protein
MGLKGRSHGLVALLSWNLPKGTDKNHEKPQSGWPIDQPKLKPVIT